MPGRGDRACRSVGACSCDRACSCDGACRCERSGGRGSRSACAHDQPVVLPVRAAGACCPRGPSRRLQHAVAALLSSCIRCRQCATLVRSGRQRMQLPRLECYQEVRQKNRWPTIPKPSRAEALGQQSNRRQREKHIDVACLLYTSPSPRDRTRSRMPSSA